jgi:hypothetical protein
MHYAPAASDEQDSTSINLFFAQKPATRYVKSNVMIPTLGTLTNGPFVIPANQVREFHGVWTLPEAVSMLGVAPHCHKLGQRWIVFAITPTQDTVHLIRVNDWDFNWQGTFYFDRLIYLPKNTVIHAYAKYDNTSNNIQNPNNPPKLITWGENTSDEMFYLPLIYLSYQAGDEDIVFNDVSGVDDNPQYFTVKDALYPVLSPNPAVDRVKVGFTLANATPVSLQLFNAQGELIKSWIEHQFYLPGLHTRELELGVLAAGVYTLVLETSDKRRAQQLVISPNR